jgi:anti-sigma regulatory factor (Ser/Thr protein kinase)
MDSPASRLRHHAFVYDSDAEYVERSVAFLADGLAGGEAAVVAASRDRLALIREALGDDARRVSLTDVGMVYTRPARAVAAYYSTLVHHLRSAPSVRVLAEGQFGPTPAEWEMWTAYEAITNRAYAHLPAWVVCTYNAQALPDPVVEMAWRTHAEVLEHDWVASPRFEDPEDLVRAMTPDPRSLPELRSLAPGGAPAAFRERMSRELEIERIPPPKALHALIAANEVALNAWQHGGGLEEVRVGRVEERFVCEVCDRGPGFDDPLAGYIPPTPADWRRAGLWIARQLTWRLEHFSSDRGHTVRIWL